MKTLFSFFLLCLLPVTFLYAEETPEDFYLTRILNQRHSGYSFDIEKSVPFDTFIKLSEAAKLTPSSYNDQPWRFIFTDKEKTPKAYDKALACILGKNKDWAMNAPVLVVVAANTKFSKTQKTNVWGLFDTGAAVMTLSLKATAIGLMTHEIGGFDSELTKQFFDIPEDFIPITIIAMGYETSGELPAPKNRNPLDVNFFCETWGIGMTPDLTT